MTAISPTLADPTEDYIPAGVRRFLFVPTIADPSAPTVAELNAGTDYSKAINAYAGFTVTAAEVDNSSYGGTFNTSVPGVTSSDSSTWTLKADKLGADARVQLTRGLDGFVVIAPGGFATGALIDVWPVRISSSNTDTVARDALATFTVSFAIPDEPVQNVVVPST